MRTRNMFLKRMICLAAALLMAAGMVCTASADQDVVFNNVKEVMKYIQANNPTDLDLGTLRVSPKELERIANALPEGAKLHFSTKYCGTVISDTDEIVDLNNGDTFVRASDLEIMIRLMPGVKKIIVSNHKNLSNKEMIPLIEKYPDIEFVWKVSLSSAYRVPSDATAFTTNKSEKEGYKLHSSDMYALKYVKNLKALDIGHCAITSLDFLEGMDLELLILSDNKITDISILGTMPHLQYLEVFRNNITDISPLANCTELIDLNISITKVTDLTPLDACTKLERLWLCTKEQTVIPSEENKDHFRSTHPDCIVMDKLYHPTSHDWREHPRYNFYRKNLLSRTWIPFSEMDNQ